MQYPYLISRTIDPIFAIGIGAASYFLHEKRVGREDGHHLHELVLKRYQAWTSK